MNRFGSSVRLGLACAGLLLLAACALTIAFDMPQDLQVDATSTAVNSTFAFDLASTQAVQDHKADVTSLSLKSVDATITTLAATNRATSVTGTLALRADGAPANGSQDIHVGTLTSFAVTQGATFHFDGNAQLDAFMLSTIKGSGKFSVIVAGTTAGGEAHMTIHAILHASLGYSGGFL